VPFVSKEENPGRYQKLLAGLQRLRGRVYLADGALAPWDLTDGRHCQSFDTASWHVISVDSKDNVYGCARLRPHSSSVDFNEMSTAHADIAKSDRWSAHVRRAIAKEVHAARQRGISIVEVGGWALADELRHGTEALRIALATYGLGQLLGGCIGFTTATVRHCSAMILRRIGGQLLRDDQVEIPRYWDEQYKCEMEILRFDSSEPNEKYRSWVEEAASELASVHVVFGEERAKAAAASHAGFSGMFSPVAYPFPV
jgi:hypothetical protein